MISPVKKSYLFTTAIILSAIGILASCNFNQHPELTITECIYNNDRYYGVAELIINDKTFTIDCSSPETLQLDFEEEFSQLSLTGNAGGDLMLSAPKSITVADDQIELNLVFTDELSAQPRAVEDPADPDLTAEPDFMMPDEFVSQTRPSDSSSAGRGSQDTSEETEQNVDITFGECLDENENLIEGTVMLTVDEDMYSIDCGSESSIRIEPQTSTESLALSASLSGYDYTGVDSIDVRSGSASIPLRFSEIPEEPAAPSTANENAGSNNAELVFQVQPAGSEVNIVNTDNSESLTFNASNGTAVVPAGTYEWTANADGYNSSSGRIDISAGRNVILAVLEEEIKMGRIMIDVRPEEATVRLEDQNSNDEYTLDASENGDIPVGMYSYAIAADGYERSTGSIEIKENERATIAEVLNVGSLVDYIEELENTNEVNQARQLIRIAPGGVPDLSPENKNIYYNELYRLATLLYNEGFVSESVSLFEKIIDEYNSAYQARFSLADYYITNSDSESGFETARDILSPLFGSLRFNIPASKRAEVELIARYYYALSYYEQVYITSDRDQRSVISKQAISQLREAEARIEDALARGNVSPEMQEYKSNATEYIAIVEADLINQN